MKINKASLMSFFSNVENFVQRPGVPTAINVLTLLSTRAPFWISSFKSSGSYKFSLRLKIAVLRTALIVTDVFALTLFYKLFKNYMRALPIAWYVIQSIGFVWLSRAVKSSCFRLKLNAWKKGSRYNRDWDALGSLIKSTSAKELNKNNKQILELIGDYSSSGTWPLIKSILRKDHFKIEGKRLVELLIRVREWGDRSREAWDSCCELVIERLLKSNDKESISRGLDYFLGEKLVSRKYEIDKYWIDQLKKYSENSQLLSIPHFLKRCGELERLELIESLIELDLVKKGDLRSFFVSAAKDKKWEWIDQLLSKHKNLVEEMDLENLFVIAAQQDKWEWIDKELSVNTNLINGVDSIYSCSECRGLMDIAFAQKKWEWIEKYSKRAGTIVKVCEKASEEGRLEWVDSIIEKRKELIKDSLDFL